MRTISQNNVVVVNLDTVTRVFSWSGQLSACMAGANSNVKVGDIAFALRHGYVVAAGRVTECSFWQMGGSKKNKVGLISKVWVRMNLYPELSQATLSATQKAALKASAQRHGCAYPDFEDVLAIDAADTQHFAPLASLLQGAQCMVSTMKRDEQAEQLLHIIARADISAEAKIRLCDALRASGNLAVRIYDRDEHRSVTDHELDWVATRIVPWEASSDIERLDANNYILLDAQLADHFAMGLVSFQSTGEQTHDPAMDHDAFDPWVDCDFNLPTLNKHQKKYLAYHRAHVFQQWRSGMPKPVYVPGA